MKKRDSKEKAEDSKKTTNEVIESIKYPYAEEALTKVGGHPPEPTSSRRRYDSVWKDPKKINRYLKKTNYSSSPSRGRGYTEIHTHPTSQSFLRIDSVSDAEISFGDVTSFLLGKAKYSVISLTDIESGEEYGRLIFKKSTKARQRAIMNNRIREIKRSPDQAEEKFNEIYADSWEDHNRKVADYYGLTYRAQPILTKREKKSHLETAVGVTVIIISSILLLTLISLNLTGNIVYNLEGSNINLLSIAILLGISIALFFLFRKILSPNKNN